MFDESGLIISGASAEAETDVPKSSMMLDKKRLLLRKRFNKGASWQHRSSPVSCLCLCASQNQPLGWRLLCYWQLDLKLYIQG